jgi:DNA-binding ferritin-like protein
MAAVRDSISEDLLIDVVRTLEKQHWMLRALRDPS